MTKAISRMSDEEYERFMASAKTCRRCKRDLARRDFPTALAHGRMTVRSWCSECLKSYYRTYGQAQRAQFKALKAAHCENHQ